MRPIALVALLPLAAFAQTSTPEPAVPAAVPPAAASPAAPPAVPPAAASPVAPSAAVVAPPAASPRPASWSIGAGVGFDSSLSVSPQYLLLYSGMILPPPETPFVAASLERRLSARTWLVVGLNGSIARQRNDLDPNATGVTRSDQEALALTFGIRHVLTPSGAPVDVSALVLADGGASWWDGDAVVYDFPGSGLVATTFDQRAWRVGASAGIAVDRELTGSLSLRVATPLVAVSYTSTETHVSGRPTLDGETLLARAVIAPRLELRLAF